MFTEVYHISSKQRVNIKLNENDYNDVTFFPMEL